MHAELHIYSNRRSFLDTYIIYRRSSYDERCAGYTYEETILGGSLRSCPGRRCFYRQKNEIHDSSFILNGPPITSFTYISLRIFMYYDENVYMRDFTQQSPHNRRSNTCQTAKRGFHSLVHGDTRTVWAKSETSS